MGAEPFYTRHRGPYRLQVCRLTPTRKVKYHTQTLMGLVDGEDVEAEARALLDDPRDTIDAVYVWSEYEQQHCITFRRNDGKGA